jgi:hypothetical protein
MLVVAYGNGPLLQSFPSPVTATIACSSQFPLPCNADHIVYAYHSTFKVTLTILSSPYNTKVLLLPSPLVTVIQRCGICPCGHPGIPLEYDSFFRSTINDPGNVADRIDDMAYIHTEQRHVWLSRLAGTWGFLSPLRRQIAKGCKPILSINCKSSQIRTHITLQLQQALSGPT